jgi:hypothetical protein
MSQRKLAHIEKIDSITPIKGADFVVMALVQGYETVVKKDDFKVGDTIVYIECDSLCPETPYFEFLRETKFKIKIRRFKGQISMGLVMPLSILPKGIYKIGDDVTELLQIRNYVKMQEDSDELANISSVEKKSRSVLLKFLMRNSAFRKLYLKLNSVSKGNWPNWISKTDEVRCIHSGVLIKTDTGDIDIENLIKNYKKYKVLSINLLNSKLEFKKITNINIKENNNNWLEIKTKSGKVLKLTSDHRIYLPELMCYRECKNIKIGDKIIIHNY